MLKFSYQVKTLEIAALLAAGDMSLKRNSGYATATDPGTIAPVAAVSDFRRQKIVILAGLEKWHTLTAAS